MKSFPALFLFIFLTLLLLLPGIGDAVPTFVLKGRVTDSDGKPVAGGEIFIYNNPQTRRPADFISPKTDRDGAYITELPAGRYWSVARVRSGDGYGPLALGKRHSGEAREIEGEAGSEIVLDFVVADVREMAKSQRKSGEDFSKVEGRILDREGRPVRGAYAFARDEKNVKGVPDFVSPQSDEEGRYVIYIPTGKLCLGAAIEFPPEEGSTCNDIFVKYSTNDVAKDFRLHYSNNQLNNGEHIVQDAD